MKSELYTWRFLSNFWGILTAIAFLINFLHILDLSTSIKTLSIIYIGVLSLFATSKEFSRWQDPNFSPKHHGELFILIWTMILFGFIVLNAINADLYHVPGELTATYLSILGVFAISRKSRKLKHIYHNKKTKKK